MSLDDPRGVLAKAAEAGWRRALIITALPHEMAEVRKHTIPVASCQARDGNVHELGHFHASGSDWLVVVGESGAGNHQSQAIVTNACIEFGPFEIILFVGVAASRKPDDAPIGSVVVSDHIYFPYGGKYTPGNFQARPRDFPINSQLLGLARKVVRDEKWHERLTPPYGGAKPWDDVYPKPFPPTAKVAPIVSVEAVSADVNSSLEQRISQNYQDATALEMEGYGTIFAAFSEETPCIIIRGISDDRAGKDPTLDKLYQPIAAAHGTALAYELLDLWGQVKQPPTGLQIVSAVSTIATSTPPTPQAVVEAATPPNATFAPGLIKNMTLVLSFAGDANDFPESKQEQILEAVRAVTDNFDISIIGSDAGSFHLFLNVNENDLVRLQSANLSEQLLKTLGVQLTNIQSRAEYEYWRAAADRLVSASAPVLNWPRTLPDGTAIRRPELSQLLEIDDNADGHTKAVIGEPGSGKTALLGALAHELKLAHVPFLAIKADFLPEDVSTEAELRDALRLSDLPTRILERLASRGPVFLIIDQLDALAGYVDLRTGRLSVLLNMVRELGSKQNVYIVVSARRFEYEHDTRLKTVKAESVYLELPPWSSVVQVLEANGIQAAGWPPDAQQVMRSPQSIATLLRLTEASKSEPFDQYQKMLERLWSERILSRANGTRAARLAGKIAEEMASKETLWLARSRYDSDADDLQALLTENILTSPAGSPGSIGFSHQTIFEFALARSFAQQEGTLSTYVRDRVTSLFIRPKLWASLTYLRAVEPPTYESELRAIWALPGLRLHLRHLIIEFTGQQSTPLNAEIEIMQEAVASSDRRAALQAVPGSAGWFFYFKNTEIAKAMLDSAEAGVAAFILAQANKFAWDDVIALINKHWMPNQSFDGYSWRILQDTAKWSDDHLAIASTILSRTEISEWAFDRVVSTIGIEQPDIAVRLVLERLTSMLRKAETEAATRKLAHEADTDADSWAKYFSPPSEPIERLIERTEGWDSLEALAKANPATYLTHIWPWLHNALETLKRYKQKHDNELTYDLPYALDIQFEEEGSRGLPEPPILGSLRIAAETFASHNSNAFLQWFESVESENATCAQRLLAHALLSVPDRYASRALVFLISDGRRFNLGNIEDYSETTKRLIEAVSPYWMTDEINEFVEALLRFSPRPSANRDVKSRQIFYQQIQRIRYELCAALPRDRLPTKAAALIAQGERKFGYARRGVAFSGPAWVGPSMSAQAIAKAADDDVVHAFEELPDETGWDNPRTWRKGGNIQLSRSFADFAKENPSRAIDIIKKFTPGVGSRAAGYAIEAMAEAVGADLLLPLVLELEGRKFESDEYRTSVAHAIEKLIDREIQIDDRTLVILKSWLASNAATASSDEPETEHSETEQPEKNAEAKAQSILWGHGGIMILPGGNFPVIEAISRIYLQREDHDGLLNFLRLHLQQIEGEEVWKALLHLLPYVRNVDKHALSEFYRTLFAKYPKIAESHAAVTLVARVYWSVPDFVFELLNEWGASSAEFLQQAYGELAALIWLMRPELDWPHKVIDDVLASPASSPKRTGAAFAAIHVWAEMPDKVSAPALIRNLTKDASEDTWSAVIDIFRLVDEISPDANWISILRAIVDEIPRQTRFMSTFVVEKIQTLLPHEAELVGTMAKALVKKWNVELGDMQTHHSSIAPEIIDIAITLHRLGARTRELGLEIFEQLLTINAYTARDTLDQIDNRFRSTPELPRPRLPRRTRRASRRARRKAA